MNKEQLLQSAAPIRDTIPDQHGEVKKKRNAIQ